MSDVKHGYKAFDPGLVCRGKQYAENTTFEEAGGEICGAGMMHYCINPLDCLDYYPLVRDDGQLSDFAEVFAEEEPVTDDGKKYASKKLHIGAKLAASGYNSQLAASGDNSKLAASGDNSQLAASGDNSVVAGIGIKNIAKAALGGWVCLAEWTWDGVKYNPVCVKAARVDGETIKPDTFYKLENGEFVEV